MSQSFEEVSTIRPVAGESLGGVRQFVIFTLGAQQYCLDIMAVREIRASNVITSLPSSPDFVRGVINLRGTIIPIIDLRTRFGLERSESAQSQVVVIIMIDGPLYGLLVDGVYDILTVRQSDIAAVPDTVGENRHPLFDGLITQGDTMLIVIALERLAMSFAQSVNNLNLPTELTVAAA